MTACDRCGVVDGAHFLESYNPLTEVHVTYHLCPDCMFILDRMMRIMIEEGCE